MRVLWFRCLRTCAVALGKRPGFGANRCSRHAGTARICRQRRRHRRGIPPWLAKVGADMVIIWCVSARGVPTPCARPASSFRPGKDAARIEGSSIRARTSWRRPVCTADSEIVDSPAHLDAALDRFRANTPWRLGRDQRRPPPARCGVTADRDGARTRNCPEAGHPVILARRVSLFCRRPPSWVRCCRHGTSSESVRTTPDLAPAGAAAAVVARQHLSGQRDRRTGCAPAWKLVLRIAVCWSRDYAAGRRWSSSAADSAIGDPSRAGAAPLGNCFMPLPGSWPISADVTVAT